MLRFEPAGSHPDRVLITLSRQVERSGRGRAGHDRRVHAGGGGARREEFIKIAAVDVTAAADLHATQPDPADATDAPPTDRDGMEPQLFGYLAGLDSRASGGMPCEVEIRVTGTVCLLIGVEIRSLPSS